MANDDTVQTVTCSRLGRELPAITTRISFVGEFGDRIRAEVSQQAWGEWLEMQIKIINEYKLHMGEAAHRQVVKDFAEKFFCFDGGDGTIGVAGPEGGLDGEPGGESS